MSGRLLLDTCAVIWMATDENQMSRDARQALDEAFFADLAVGVSPITAWELGLLGRSGRLPAPIQPARLFERFASAEGIRLEALTPAILIDSSFLPGEFHNDPADRIIVATARTLELTVVTRDRAILDYARQGYVLALPC
jgi:PIN domain nuclease of toxin-antitoxin system